MRGLKCKVLMLCEKMFESKEAPKAFYREKRLHKYYKELKKLKKKKLKNRMEDVKKGKHKFYVSSKRQLRRDYTHRKFLIEPKKSKAKSARNQLRNFKSKLGREESYPFLSLTNQDLLRFPNKVKLISEKLKTWEVDLISDDPLFFFSINGEVLHEELVDQKEWENEVERRTGKEIYSKKGQTKPKKGRERAQSHRFFKPSKPRNVSLTKPMATTITGFRKEKSMKAFDNDYFKNKKFEILEEGQIQRLERNRQRIKKNEKNKRRVEKKKSRNMKHKIETFDRRMNQGMAIAKAVKKSSNLLYLEAVKKAKEKKQKIMEKKLLIEKNRELNRLSDLIKHEAVKFKSSFVREMRRKAYEDKYEI